MSITPHVDGLKSKLLGRQIYDELYVEDYLAHGSYGAVFRVADRAGVRQLALKVMHRSSQWEEESTLHYFLSNHPNIVTLHENIELGDYAASLLDYCPGGSLHELIYDRCAYAGDSARIKSAFLQIIDAVDHCHTNYVYHRDLKPLNVLCNEDGSRVFLTDFGLSTRDDASHEHSRGTVAYMSPGTFSQVRVSRVRAYFLPECYREGHSRPKKAPYSPEANDVWSLGVLFLDLACGERIWESPTTRDERYRKFSEDPSTFLRSEYPFNDHARHLLLRIFSPELYRIPLKTLREEIRLIDNFYLSDHEIASATVQVRRNAIRYGPWTNLAEEDYARLAGVLHGCGVHDFAPNGDSDESSTEFVEIDLTTPPNEPLHFHSDFIKGEEQPTPWIAELCPSTY